MSAILREKGSKYEEQKKTLKLVRSPAIGLFY